MDASLLDGQGPGDFAPATHTHRFDSLTSLPAGLSDGDDDSLGELSCSNGQVAKWNGSAWACAADVDTDTDTNTDVLAGISCSAGQIAKWNGSAWVCASDADSGSSSDTLGSLLCSNGQIAKALSAASMRRRRGSLLGGDEGTALVAEAKQTMRAQGVVRPEVCRPVGF